MVKRETGAGRRAKRYWRGRWRDVDSDERFLGLGDLAVAESCSFRVQMLVGVRSTIVKVTYYS
jgi:hypothetical protein